MSLCTVLLQFVKYLLWVVVAVFVVFFLRFIFCAAFLLLLFSVLFFVVLCASAVLLLYLLPFYFVLWVCVCLAAACCISHNNVDDLIRYSLPASAPYNCAQKNAIYFLSAKQRVTTITTQKPSSISVTAQKKTNYKNWIKQIHVQKIVRPDSVSAYFRGNIFAIYYYFCYSSIPFHSSIFVYLCSSVPVSWRSALRMLACCIFLHLFINIGVVFVAAFFALRLFC